MQSLAGRQMARALVGVALVLTAALGRPAAASVAQVNDPGYALQWGLSAVHASDAWQYTDGSDVTIAIVDSGIDLGHEDLRSQLAPGSNATCLNTGGDPANCTAGGPDDGRDDAGHGTHVAGIAAAAAGNGRGVAGVAPGARIMPVRVLERACVLLGGCDSRGTAADVSAGIRWAVDHGADVVNLSLGNVTQSVVGPAFRDAVQYAWSRGAITVVAAGNDIVLPSGFTDEPALVVAALNRSGRAATYSNGVGGAQWALSAPGGERDSEDSCNSGSPNGIVSTYYDPNTPADDYFCLAGTSMAAPFVSGAAALLLSVGLSPQDVVTHLLATAEDLGREGPDETYGAGALDIANAFANLRWLHPTTTAPPTSAAPTEPTEPTTPTTATTTTTTAPTTTETTLPPDTTPTTTTPENAGQPVKVDPAGSSRSGRENAFYGLAVTIAALLVISVGTTSVWVLVRGSSWAQRTPG